MNWSRFFSMGGYAFYVWGSYVIALIVMGGEVVALRQRRKTAAARTDNISPAKQSERL